MENNIFIGGNSMVLIADTDIDALNFDQSNIRKVIQYGKNGSPDRSYTGSGLDTLTGILPKNSGITVFAKVEMDRTSQLFGGGFVGNTGNPLTAENGTTFQSETGLDIIAE